MLPIKWISMFLDGSQSKEENIKSSLPYKWEPKQSHVRLKYNTDPEGQLFLTF